MKIGYMYMPSADTVNDVAIEIVEIKGSSVQPGVMVLICKR
jgi:hypothetical protein